MKSKFSDNYNIHFSSVRQIDIISKNLSQGNVVTNTLNKLKLGYSDIYIFGDSENDLSMLNLSKNAFDMENSRIENKNEYNIVLSKDEDGFAKIIKKIM